MTGDADYLNGRKLAVPSFLGGSSHDFDSELKNR